MEDKKQPVRVLEERLESRIEGEDYNHGGPQLVFDAARAFLQPGFGFVDFFQKHYPTQSDPDFGTKMFDYVLIQPVKTIPYIIAIQYLLRE